jgi:hypothetical protein
VGELRSQPPPDPAVIPTSAVCGSNRPVCHSPPCQFAVRQLSQFARVVLSPGQSQWVSLNVPLRQPQYGSAADQKWLIAAGRRILYVGDADSSARLPLQTTLDIPADSDVTCVDQQLSPTMISDRPARGLV